MGNRLLDLFRPRPKTPAQEEVEELLQTSEQRLCELREQSRRLRRAIDRLHNENQRLTDQEGRRDHD